MKITNDRLAVAWAVQEHIEFLMGESFDLYPEEVIAAIPEPPDDSPATLPAGGWVVMDGDGKHYRTWRDGFPAWTSEAGKATRYLRREDAEAVHYEDEGAWLVVPQQSEPLPAPTGPGWPDWLSPEYQAIVKMVKDAMRRAERNVYAGAIVHAFKCAGWMPPLVAPTAKGGAE